MIPVRTLIERELDDLRNKPVSPAELDLAKHTLLHQLALSGTSTDGRASLLLGLAHDELPLELPEVAACQVRLITPNQVQAAFRRWLRPGGFVQITSGLVPEAVEKRRGRQ